MTKPREITCPKCGGAEGWEIDPDRRARVWFDDASGETFASNWEVCDECGGDGTIEEDEEEDE